MEQVREVGCAGTMVGQVSYVDKIGPVQQRCKYTEIPGKKNSGTLFASV
jgi:hypothetical protein